jgi:hypothetical protein
VKETSLAFSVLLCCMEERVANSVYGCFCIWLSCSLPMHLESAYKVSNVYTVQLG